MKHELICYLLRNHFHHAVEMIECMEESELEDIDLKDAENLLIACIRSPDGLEKTVSKFWAREMRTGYSAER
jgi:hypothetical protein